MSAKASFPIAVLLTVLGLWNARGQDEATPIAGGVESAAPQEALPAPRDIATMPAPQPDQAFPVPPSLTSPMSSWIIHNQTDCCGPIGGSGPINTELFIRTGPTLPVAGGFLHKVLDTGWVFGGGGRSMFFNPAVDAAWTADLSLLYFYNHARPNPKILVTADISNPPVGLPAGPGVRVQGHVKDLNRTFVTAALGREWYLNAPANAAGWKWRAGFDIGGRLGTGVANFALEPNQGFIGQSNAGLEHKTDTLYGLDLSLHTDLDIPWGCCTFTYGFRVEWDYTWMDILQPRNAHLAQPLNSQLQDVNLLLTFGVRF
jgi:hypothetical protein